MRKNISAFFVLSVLTLFFLSCSSHESQRSEFVLGTVCTLNLYDDGTKSLYDELFSRLYEIDSVFNVNDADSEISKINNAAGVEPVQVSEELFYVIQTALHYSALTDGAFDPTVGPLVKLWGINTDHAHVPEKEEIEAALPLVDWRNVELVPYEDKSEFDMPDKMPVEAIGGSVFLCKAGMSLDLGAIAKGYAADALVKILRGHNKIKCAVIDLGGNIYVYGKKADGTLWKVGVKDPENPEEGTPALILSLSDSTVVTSGVYERFFIQDGKRYHHIINPKTGYPAESGLLSSTVICGSSIAADALSTSVFVLGEEKGFALIDKISDSILSGLQSSSGGNENSEIPYALFISSDHRIFASRYFKDIAAPGSALYSDISYR